MAKQKALVSGLKQTRAEHKDESPAVNTAVRSNPIVAESLFEGKPRFMDVREVMQDAGIGKSKAYEVIHRINESLEKEGFLTFRGKVLRRYYYAMTGGTVSV